MIHFAKMQGLGNDFVVINTLDQKINHKELPVSQLANRHLGIGFDQLLLISASTKADFFCQIFNSDGSEAEQCGNGLRCIARYIHDKKLHPGKLFTIETKGGVFSANLLSPDSVQVSMGTPQFEPSLIPFTAERLQKSYSLKVGPDQTELAVLSMGNPHAILRVETLHNFPVQELGRAISLHRDFPKGTNVGFMEILNREQIKLRTYERGSGETYACGSNACAAVVAAIQNDWVDRKVKVELALGNLWIEWQDDSKSVLMTGEAEWVYEGTLNH